MEALLPRQYIDGRVNFFGYDFVVTPDVLIPRPETEILAERVIKLVRNSCAEGRADILDIGTGSGNIAVSLAKELEKSRIAASDISKKALRVAERNAAANGVSERVKFISSDLFADIEDFFDIIISNPPYVARRELSELPDEVLAEPLVALDGGPDGLDVIRRIIEESPKHLPSGGYLFLEIGYDQSGAVRDLISRSGALTLIDIIKDYSGIDRIIIARNLS